MFSQWFLYTSYFYMMDNNLTLEDMGDFEQSELVETIKWVAYSIVAYVIVGVGILGNLASLVVLTRPNLKVGIIITSYLFANNFDIINWFFITVWWI